MWFKRCVCALTQSSVFMLNSVCRRFCGFYLFLWSLGGIFFCMPVLLVRISTVSVLSDDEIPTCSPNSLTSNSACSVATPVLSSGVYAIYALYLTIQQHISLLPRLF